MFGPLIIDEDALLSMTAGRATYAALMRGDIFSYIGFICENFDPIFAVNMSLWRPSDGQSSRGTVLREDSPPGHFPNMDFPTHSSSQWCTDSLIKFN